jgi:hypothetical protein
MKAVNLNKEECAWLSPLLEQRAEMHETSEYSIPQKHVLNTISALKKVSTGFVSHLNEWERVMCSSCASEELYELYQSIPKTDAYSLLNCTASDLAHLMKIDLGEEIKTRLGRSERKSSPFYYKRTSYQEYLNRLAKLKRSEIIFMSGSNGIIPYKIGFVSSGKEICVFELRRKIELYSICFHPINMDPYRYGQQYFQRVVNREQAYNALKPFSEDVEEKIKLICQLLN